MREQALLEERLPHEVGEIANRQVDLSFLERQCGLIGWHRYGSDRRVGCLRADLFEDAWQEHHLAYIRECECKWARADAGVELLFRQYTCLYLHDEGSHGGD